MGINGSDVGGVGNPEDTVNLVCSAANASEETDDANEAVKKETEGAYDMVGSTASLPGNVRKAKAIMSHLGYTEEEQSVVGLDDLYNYQGVGNPFLSAKPKAGDRVLDLGSGLGVDSFLAAFYVGPKGSVIGVDLAKKQVDYANRRATHRAERGALSSSSSNGNVNGSASVGTAASNIQNVSFVKADIEKLFDGTTGESSCSIASGLQAGSFDVVISNGAFCLAPDKKRAFASVYK